MAAQAVLFAIQLVAQQPGGDAKGGPESPFMNPLFLFVAMGLLFYFMLLRPARRQEKDRQAMVEALKRDDEVVTSSGILGTVISIKKDKDEIILESGSTRLRVLKSSVARVLAKSDRAEEPAGESKAKESET